ncbi:DUF134 domain-containing protein [uncultured Lutibacter sp.]|uniref:DUF134 domain-containing protein n=1 Tax=uncultured Lutibacter sp. TaxID=437739 RepID=UPI00262A7D94|nr:DUF134 domain-containing protein [uncultured Lutibacter sp.]
MPRPEKNRKIGRPPLMQGFKPFGIPLCKIEKIKLTFEEYESIRLVTYNRLPQDKAAEQMNISRPTLTRIYNKALKNIAKAFVEGKAIEFEGGNYELDKEWYRCAKCYNLIENPRNQKKCKNCIDYSEDELIKLNNKVMPNLDHKGPDGLGPKSGRKLGKCRKTEAEKKEIVDLGARKGKQHCNGKGQRKKVHKKKD